MADVLKDVPTDTLYGTVFDVLVAAGFGGSTTMGMLNELHRRAALSAVSQDGEDTRLLEWVFDQCNDPGHTVEEIGRYVCAVIAGGRVGDTIYANERDAIRAAIAEEASNKNDK